MARSAMPPCLRAREGGGTTYSGAMLRTLRTTAGTTAGAGRRSPWSASSSSPVGIWDSESKKYLRAAVWHLFSDLSSQPPFLLRQVDNGFLFGLAVADHHLAVVVRLIAVVMGRPIELAVGDGLRPVACDDLGRAH